MKNSDKIFHNFKIELQNIAPYSQQISLMNAKLNVNYAINVEVLRSFCGIFYDSVRVRLHNL
jgi:hypothetical protein